MEEKKIAAPFTKGIDAGGQHPLLVSDGLIKCENGYFRRGCVVSRAPLRMTYPSSTPPPLPFYALGRTNFVGRHGDLGCLQSNTAGRTLYDGPRGNNAIYDAAPLLKFFSPGDSFANGEIVLGTNFWFISFYTISGKHKLFSVDVESNQVAAVKDMDGISRTLSFGHIVPVTSSGGASVYFVYEAAASPYTVSAYFAHPVTGAWTDDGELVDTGTDPGTGSTAYIDACCFPSSDLTGNARAALYWSKDTNHQWVYSFYDEHASATTEHVEVLETTTTPGALYLREVGDGTHREVLGAVAYKDASANQFVDCFLGIPHITSGDQRITFDFGTIIGATAIAQQVAFVETTSSPGTGARSFMLYVTNQFSNAPPNIIVASATYTAENVLVVDYTAAGSYADVTWGGALFAKPFYADVASGVSSDIILPQYFQGGRWYDVGGTARTEVDAGTTQRTYFFMDGTTVKNETPRRLGALAKCLVGKAGHTHYSPGTSTYLALLGSGMGSLPRTDLFGSCVPCGIREDLQTIGIAAYNITDRSSFDDFGYYDAALDVTPVEVGDQVIIPGSCPRIMSGSIVPHMIEFPEGIFASTPTGTAGDWSSEGSTGTTQIRATYEYIDPSGTVHRSSPSTAISVSIDDYQKTFTVSVPTPSISANDLLTANSTATAEYTKMLVCFYRTLLNGDKLFKVGQVGPNSLNAAYVTFTITGKESIAVTSGSVSYPVAQALYTETESENIQMFPHRISCAFQDRYAYVDRDNETNSIYYTKPPLPGYAPESNEFYKISVPSSGGAITAMRELDEKLIVFKSESIYSCHGDALNEALGGAGMSRPRQIASGVGCIAHASAVRIPNGVCFLSHSGFQLLGRDEALKYIGLNVRYYTDSYHYGRGTVDNSRNQVIWTSYVSGAPALVYNYDIDQWSTFSGNYAGALAICCDPNLGEISTINHAGTYVYSTAGSVSTDEDYDLSVESGTYAFDGILGFLRLKYMELLLEKAGTVGDLTLGAAYDMDALWDTGSAQTFDLSTLQDVPYTAHLGSMTSAALQDQAAKLKVLLNRQKTDAVRFKLVVDNAGGNVSLVGFNFYVGAKKTPSKIGSGRTL